MAVDSGYLMTYCNSAGEVVYCDGKLPLLLKAEDVNLSLGSDWSEGSAGTNGIGTALATKAPIQVFASEHFCHEIQSWNCSASPVRDPATGKIIGIVNVSCFWTSNPPKMLDAVVSTAQAIENMLCSQLKADRYRLSHHFGELTRKTTLPLAVLDRGGRVVKASRQLYEEGWIHPDHRLQNTPFIQQSFPFKGNWEIGMWQFELSPYYYGGMPIGSIVHVLPPDIGCFTDLPNLHLFPANRAHLIDNEAPPSQKAPQQDQLYMSFFEHHPDAIFSYDLKGTLTDANPAAARMLGFEEEEELRGANLHSLIVPKNEDQRLRAFAHAAGGMHYEYEAAFRHKQGHVLDVIVKSFPVIVENEVVGVFETARDITPSQQIFEDLKSTKEQLEFYLRNTEDAITVVDSNLRVVKANKSFETIFGWTEKELLGKELPTIPDHLKQEIEDIQIKLLHSQNVIAYDTIRQRKDGSLIDISNFASPLFDSKGNPVAYVLISKDITERKRMSEALMESEKRLRTLIDALPDIVVFKDDQGRWIEANHTALVTFQLDNVDYQGKTDSELAECNGFYRETLLQCMVSDLLAWETGSLIRGQENIPKLSGRDTVCDIFKIPVYHTDGARKGLVVIGRDITELKHTEALLRKSEKLAVVGQLAAGIAHEIRNPLTTLKGFLSLLESQLNAKSRNYLDIMRSEIEQMEWITNQFMTVAKPQAVRFHRHDLRVLIGQVTTLLYPYATMHNVQITMETEADFPFVECDGNQLKQVFINILKNAIEAMPQGGQIEIKMKRIGPDTVSVRITDHGCGIPQDRILHLGEPFYSLKEKGTGLGLMVCYKIMKEHSGTVHIESEVARGTTVEIRLPLTHA
ncbi:PAS domain S-box protein [Paenibacillus sp. MBLB4367]|uniref:PAS domain S-box protein n=1 Tax=Paenibacillus sp. MBLB4367 TaxID=3384767 RepID=UPI003907F496